MDFSNISNHVIIALIVIVIWFLYNSNGNTKPVAEDYRACFGCDDDYRMIDGGMSVINPVIWPYSATNDINNLYGPKRHLFGFTSQPLIHQFTPDHVVMTG
jgi:hypothetical protein